MPEPAATTVTGGTWALGAITLSGSILGLHYDAMLIGFVASMVALLNLSPPLDPPRTPLRVFGFVLSAAFLAGVFAPALASALRLNIDWLSALPDAALRPICAALIGGGGHIVIPLMIAALRRRARAA